MQIGMDGAASLNINQIDGSVINAGTDAAVNLKIIADGDLNLNIADKIDQTVKTLCDGEFGVFTKISGGDMPDYTGVTEVTPTRGTQTLQTAGKAVHHNIVINPIPSNYGLITWNGSTLTVS